MSSLRQKIGHLGEKIAREYLRSKGFYILEKNFQVREGEIDLVAKKGNDLVFFEIKTRLSSSCGYPEESVTPKKKRRIYRAVQKYILRKNPSYGSLRVDVLTLEKEGDKIKIRHYPNIIFEF
jgi:putative endonuclease